MIQSGEVVSIQHVPVWLLRGFAALGIGIFIAALFWIAPPAVRRREALWSAVAAMAIFIPAVLRAGRVEAWLVGVCFAIGALPILWMGRMPADMPPATNPMCRLHPQYRRVARRGRIAGLAMIVLAVIVIVLSTRFVGGV